MLELALGVSFVQFVHFTKTNQELLQAIGHCHVLLPRTEIKNLSAGLLFLAALLNVQHSFGIIEGDRNSWNPCDFPPFMNCDRIQGYELGNLDSRASPGFAIENSGGLRVIQRSVALSH